MSNETMNGTEQAFVARFQGTSTGTQHWRLNALTNVKSRHGLYWDVDLEGTAGGQGWVRFLYPSDPRPFLIQQLEQRWAWHELLGLLCAVGWAQLRDVGVVNQRQVSAAMRGLNPLCYVPSDYVTRVRFRPNRPDPWEIEYLDGTVYDAKTLQSLHLLLWTAPQDTDRSELAHDCRRHPNQWRNPER